MIRKIVFELMVGFLIAMVPIAYAFIDTSTERQKEMIGALMLSNGFILYYMLTLFVAYLAVAGLNWLIWKPTDLSRQRWNFWTGVLLEAGSGVIGILRATAGVLLAFPILWLVTEPETVKFGEAAEMFAIGVVGLFECAILKSWQTDLQLKTRVSI